jgi:cysteine desulfurase
VRTIYLDYNATTPLDPAVKAAMLPALEEVWGNPSSVHHLGQRARSLLDDSRDRIASVLGCLPSELIFTSGATESANLALFGAARLLRNKGRHIITSAIEHHAVLKPCEFLAKNEGFDLTILPVDSVGRVSVDSVREALRPDTILVSIMAANNEIGTIQPVAEIGSLCQENGVLFHTDAVQWFGKLPFSSFDDFNANLVSLCPHKFCGPKGVGLLFCKSPLNPSPIILGGSHENERRGGTENLPAIVGLAEAISLFVPSPVFSDSLSPLSERLISSFDSLEGAFFIGDRFASGRLSNTVSFSFDSSDSIALLGSLDLEGICASGGSACSSGSVSPSHVVLSLGYSASQASAFIRFSLGRETSSAEIDFLLGVFPSVLSRCRPSNKRV